MVKLKEEGFEKKELSNGWKWYTHEEGYSYFTKKFGDKTVLLDNFSVSPIVVSTESLDENFFEETLQLVYSTNEITESFNDLKEIEYYVSVEAYKESVFIVDKYLGSI